MAKKKGDTGGIVIPIYLDAETYQSQLKSLPHDINARIKYMQNALETIKIKFEIDTLGATSTRAVEQLRKRMAQESKAVVDATYAEIKKIAPNGHIIPLKLELQSRQFAEELNKNSTTVEKFIAGFKGALKLPKLDLDISAAKRNLEELESQIVKTNEKINSLTKSQGNSITTLMKHGIKFDENGGLLSGQAFKSKYQTRAEAHEAKKAGLQAKSIGWNEELKSNREHQERLFQTKGIIPPELIALRKEIEEAVKNRDQSKKDLRTTETQLSQLRESEAVQKRRQSLEQEIATLRAAIKATDDLNSARLKNLQSIPKSQGTAGTIQLRREIEDSRVRNESRKMDLAEKEFLLSTLPAKATLNSIQERRRAEEQRAAGLKSDIKGYDTDISRKQQELQQKTNSITEKNSEQMKKLEAEESKLLSEINRAEVALGRIEKAIAGNSAKMAGFDKALEQYRKASEGISQALAQQGKNVTDARHAKREYGDLQNQRREIAGTNTVSTADRTLTELYTRREQAKRIQAEIDQTKKKIAELGKMMTKLEFKVEWSEGNPEIQNKVKAKLEQIRQLFEKYQTDIAKKSRELSETQLGLPSRALEGILRVQNAFQRLKIPNINDVYKKALGSIGPVVQKLQDDFRGIADSTQSFGSAVSKAFELVGNTTSLESATEGLTGFKKAFATAAVGVELGVRVFTAGVVAVLGFEKTLENFARPALEAQNALYIMSLGMHSTVDDMKQLSVLTQVAGVGMNSVQVALRRVNAQLAKTTEGSVLARETLKQYGAKLFDKNGNIKQGMEQLDEIAKAYQNAMAVGRGAEFRYRVGGRYWDNDFVALIADYASNKESMRSIVKSNLADPELAYSVRGSMYALEAQQKQFQTAFASAFMPVVEHVAPEMRQRFAELTKVIEQNAEAIKGFGFAVGEAVGALSEWGTAAITLVSKALSLLDIGAEERLQHKIIKDNEPLIGEISEALLGVKKDKQGNVIAYDKKLVSGITGGKFLEDTGIKGFESDTLKLLRELRASQRKDAQRQQSLAKFGPQATALYADEVNRTARLQKKFNDLIEASGENVDDLNKTLALQEQLLNESGGIDTEKLKSATVRALQGYHDPVTDALYGDKNFAKLAEEIRANVTKEVAKTFNMAERQARELVDKYAEGNRLAAELSKLSPEEAAERRRNFTSREKELYKDFELNSKTGVYQFSVKVDNESDEKVQEVFKSVFEAVTNRVIDDANKLDNEAQSKKAQETAGFQQDYEDLLQKIAKYKQENLALDRELQYSNYPLAQSIDEVTSAREEELKVIEKYRQTLQEEDDAQVREKGLKEAAEAEADVIAHSEKKLALINKQFADEMKQINQETYDIVYGASHSTMEKQIADIERWFQAENEKTKLLKDESKIRERTAAITANALAKEAQAFEAEMNRIRDKVQSLQEKIFNQEHRGRRAQALYNLQKELVSLAEEKIYPPELIQRYVNNELKKIAPGIGKVGLNYNENGQPVFVVPPKMFRLYDDMRNELDGIMAGRENDLKSDTTERLKQMLSTPNTNEQLAQMLSRLNLNEQLARTLSPPNTNEQTKQNLSTANTNELIKQRLDVQGAAIQPAIEKFNQSLAQSTSAFDASMLTATNATIAFSNAIQESISKINFDTPVPQNPPTQIAQPMVYRQRLEPLQPLPTDSNYRIGGDTSPNDMELTATLQTLVQSQEKYLPDIISALAPLDNITSELVELTQIAGSIAQEATQRQQPNINVTVSPNISVNLGGAYVFDNAMKAQLTDDIATEVANSVTQAVNQGISQINTSFAN